VKRRGIRVARQRKDYDCGIACLQMLTGKPYGDVAAFVRRVVDPRKLRRRGLIIAEMMGAARFFGTRIRPVWRRRGYLEDYPNGILGVIGGEMDPAGHWVILKAGTIVDPDGAEVWSVADYMAKHKSRPATLLVEVKR
jgi:hypothetical protein